MIQYRLPVDLGPDLEELWVGVASMGNPHVVILLDQPASNDLVQRLGATLESHPRFPERVNVGFLHIVDRSRVHLRVYERGVGETLACGTGACAAAVVGEKRSLSGEPNPRQPKVTGLAPIRKGINTTERGATSSP